jgi:hypothetical protein
MKGAKITLPNGKKFALVARSGSYSIIWQALPTPLRNPVGDRWHPINATTHTIGSPLDNSDIPNLCCLVRDPVERFRSSCARQQKTLEEGLESVSFDVHFWTLESMGLLAEGITHFRFPDQIDACAQWLVLETPVPILNDELEENKPVLTPEQEARVREIYANDIVVWESLQ